MQPVVSPVPGEHNLGKERAHVDQYGYRIYAGL